jgi:hypothetical protein
LRRIPERERSTAGSGSSGAPELRTPTRFPIKSEMLPTEFRWMAETRRAEGWTTWRARYSGEVGGPLTAIVRVA